MPTPNQTTPDSPERVRGEKPDIATNVRQFDLVRCMRSELHAAELITDDEFNWLCAVAPMAQGKPGQGSISRQRIEDYDQLRAETTRLAEALKEAREVLAPFAKFTFSKNSAWRDADEDAVVLCGYSDSVIGETTGVNVTLGDFARARQFLTQPAPISGAKKE